MLTTNLIAHTRITVFGLTGAVCLLYAFMALVTGRPDPLPFWVPGVCGVLAGFLLAVMSRFAGRKVANMAWDEGYVADARRAASISFWVGLMMYPVFGLLLWSGIIAWDMAFVIMGLLTGASYLLLLVWFDLRGRG